MGKALKALFGGGSAYVYIILAAIVGALLLERGHMKRSIDKLEQQSDEYKAESLSKDSTIASQARTGQRRSIANDAQQKAEDAILAAPDAVHCATSEPMVIALDWMRNKRGNTAPDNPDE